MKLVAPNYYKDFHCIADRCRHSCCIGWEIDVDRDSLAYYESVGGAFGEKLEKNILRDGDSACFRLVGSAERCPFLKENGLCEMILTLGEESLCDICREHPRFYLTFSDREEVGLGLCCEEAARLILSQTEHTVLQVLEDDGEESEPDAWERRLTEARQDMASLMQRRDVGVHQRARSLLSVYRVPFPERTAEEWRELLMALEQLDPEWERILSELRDCGEAEPADELPFEKLLIYFLYRHTAQAEDEQDLRARIAFSYLGYHIVRLLCLQHRAQYGALSMEAIADYARRYSSEIEYSEENTQALIAYFRELT